MTKVFEYIPKGVCARKMIFEIDDNIIKNITVIGGCEGNSKGVISLCKNQDINTIIEKLGGIMCGNKLTSCPNNIAQALMEYKNNVK